MDKFLKARSNNAGVQTGESVSDSLPLPQLEYRTKPGYQELRPYSMCGSTLSTDWNSRRVGHCIDGVPFTFPAEFIAIFIWLRQIIVFWDTFLAEALFPIEREGPRVLHMFLFTLM